MHLLLDTANAVSPGASRLQTELVRNLARCRPPDARLTVVTSDPALATEAAGRGVIRAERAVGWTALWRWYRSRLPQLAASSGADVVYSLSGIVSARLAARCAAICSVNNMLPFTPELVRHYPPWSRERARLILLRRTLLASARRAPLVVFPSEYGLNKVAEEMPSVREKAMVIPNPIPQMARVDPAAPPPHPYDGRPFLFYLSAVYWYKNHLSLIEGYRVALERDPKLPDLVLAGLPVDRDYVRRVETAIARPELSGRVRFLGKIEGETIPGWLHHATINLFPSTCETNSVVQAEILGAAGVMACSSWPPMPEIAGQAAELFDPVDPHSIAEVILRLAADPGRREDLRAAARRRCEDFSGERYGRAVWEAAARARRRFAG